MSEDGPEAAPESKTGNPLMVGIQKITNTVRRAGNMLPGIRAAAIDNDKRLRRHTEEIRERLLAQQFRIRMEKEGDKCCYVEFIEKSPGNLACVFRRSEDDKEHHMKTEEWKEVMRILLDMGSRYDFQEAFMNLFSAMEEARELQGEGFDPHACAKAAECLTRQLDRQQAEDKK